MSVGIVLFHQVLPVIPVAQPRQRHAKLKTKTGKEINVNYVPASHPITDFKAQARLMVSEEMRKQNLSVFDGGLVLWVEFYLPRPQRLMTKKSPEGPVPHLAKPDTDNLIKGLKDSLKGVLWHDDAQVYGYDNCRKYYCEKGWEPRVELTVIRE